MAAKELNAYLPLVRFLVQAPHAAIASSYDAQADVLYIKLKPGAHATDSELTDDDVIVRYVGNEVVGLTVLHASTR